MRKVFSTQNTFPRMKFLSRRLWKAAALGERKFEQSLPCSDRRVPLPQGYVRGVARNGRTLAQLGNNCVGGQPLARVDNWFPLIPLSRLPSERRPRTANWRDVYPAPISMPHLLPASFHVSGNKNVRWINIRENDRLISWRNTLGERTRDNLRIYFSTLLFER